MENNYKLNKKFIMNNLHLRDLNFSQKDIENILSDSNFMNECFITSQNMTIGTAILVKNQENKISDAVLDASTISDKIVVCDTGSTDGTLKVLEKISTEIPLEIKTFAWEENYAKMRNIASSFLDTDWIFIIDSDETLESAISIAQLKFCLAFLDRLFKGRDIVLSFRQNAANMNGTGYPQRLYRNSKSLSFWGYVHEELRSPNIVNIQTKLTLFNEGTHELEIDKFNKSERYDRLLLKNIEKEPNNPKWVALLSQKWILDNLDTSYGMVMKLVNNIKKNEKSDDFFEINVFSVYIIILMGTSVDFANILEEIQVAKKIFSNHPIFFYFEHTLKLIEIDNLVLKQINLLREDIDKIKAENNSNIDWLVYYPTENLECVMIKLLMKYEKYNMAYDMFLRNRQELMKTYLIDPEVNFFENIRINN